MACNQFKKYIKINLKLYGADKFSNHKERLLKRGKVESPLQELRKPFPEEISSAPDHFCT